MTMTPERFRTLIEAYGADPERWPGGERAAAETFAREQAGAAAETLAEARWLDSLLKGAPALDVSADLRAAVLAKVPQSRSSLPRISPLGWFSGAGWAAAAAAGVVVGVAVGQQLLQDWQAETVVEQAAAWSLDEAEYLG